MLCYSNPTGFGLANFDKTYLLLKPLESGEAQTPAWTMMGCYWVATWNLKFE